MKAKREKRKYDEGIKVFEYFDIIPWHWNRAENSRLSFKFKAGVIIVPYEEYP